MPRTKTQTAAATAEPPKSKKTKSSSKVRGAKKAAGRTAVKKKASGRPAKATGKSAAKRPAKKATKAAAKKTAAKKVAKKTATRTAAKKKTAVAKKAAKKAPARKKTATAKVGKKKAVAKKAAAGRTARAAGTERIIRRMTKGLLDYVSDDGPMAAAARVGLEVYEINNLRAGSHMTLPLFIKLIKRGRWTPESLIEGKDFEKLPESVATRTITLEAIDRRIKKVSHTRPAYEWVKDTGLSLHTIYSVRSTHHRPGLRTVLGFVRGGVPLRDILFGPKR